MGLKQYYYYKFIINRSKAILLLLIYNKWVQSNIVIIIHDK